MQKIVCSQGLRFSTVAEPTKLRHYPRKAGRRACRKIEQIYHGNDFRSVPAFICMKDFSLPLEMTVAEAPEP
jgi:hypothetical protein